LSRINAKDHPLFWDPSPEERIDFGGRLLPQGLLFAFHPDDTLAMTPDILRIHWKLLSRSTNRILQGNLEDSTTYLLAHKLNLIARDFRSRHLLTEATKTYQAALSMRPADHRTRNNYGALLLSQGELAKALEQFNASYDANPLNLQVNRNMGRVLLRLGDPAQAAHFFERALAFGATGEDAYVQLGEAYAKAGRFSSALSAMQSAITQLRKQNLRNPDNESLQKSMNLLQQWIHYIEAQLQSGTPAR
jgi:tetratricopeptide (TPR) repeat protein